ncbi:ribonuclease H-like protein [Lindgomyces ingoldianus]|uniref:Ribonuclease H-like protein n=1 Tax=Lindgomyces ingoldianus TaxID=673940 RepID=A0ACB6R0F5_9PLEO|nr:ribonuclease H-like protein [Lindgomyces ingoldianus]KAF2472779.1 ribonuclease H-like protein [Lindgomyces ingoldianus]
MDIVDNFPLRLNQRAELCAAKPGLEFFAEAYNKGSKSEAEAWIIATNSEYVVKGITEWLSTWKRNDWRTTKGSKSANLDLFVALDGVITKHEAENVKIGLWHIPREHNKLANRLAKAAAVLSDKARNEARM